MLTPDNQQVDILHFFCGFFCENDSGLQNFLYTEQYRWMGPQTAMTSAIKFEHFWKKSIFWSFLPQLTSTGSYYIGSVFSGSFDIVCE